MSCKRANWLSFVSKQPRQATLASISCKRDVVTLPTFYSFPLKSSSRKEVGDASEVDPPCQEEPQVQGQEVPQAESQDGRGGGEEPQGTERKDKDPSAPKTPEHPEESRELGRRPGMG